MQKPDKQRKPEVSSVPNIYDSLRQSPSASFIAALIWLVVSVAGGLCILQTLGYQGTSRADQITGIYQVWGASVILSSAWLTLVQRNGSLVTFLLLAIGSFAISGGVFFVGCLSHI